MHKRGWVHFDVKDTNIIVGAGGAYLTDFSCAGQEEEFKRRAPIWYEGILPPEYGSSDPPTNRVDVWMLGKTALCSLLGINPSDAEQKALPHYVAEAIEEGIFAHYFGRHGEPLAMLLSRMVLKEPEKRPSMKDVVEQFDGMSVGTLRDII